MTRRRWAGRNRDRIDVHESDEVEYWSKKWDVSPDRRREAVSRAGVLVKDVARELGKPA